MQKTLEQEYAQLHYDGLRIERHLLHPTGLQVEKVQRLTELLTGIHAKQREQGTFPYSEQEVSLLLAAVHDGRLTDNGLHGITQPDDLTPVEMELLLIGMGHDRARRVVDAIAAGGYVNLMTFP